MKMLKEMAIVALLGFGASAMAMEEQHMLPGELSRLRTLTAEREALRSQLGKVEASLAAFQGEVANNIRVRQEAVAATGLSQAEKDALRLQLASKIETNQARISKINHELMSGEQDWPRGISQEAATRCANEIKAKRSEIEKWTQQLALLRQ